MNISPVGAKLFHADERTDMMKLIVIFRNFANAPKNSRFFISRKGTQMCNTKHIYGVCFR